MPNQNKTEKKTRRSEKTGEKSGIEGNSKKELFETKEKRDDESTVLDVPTARPHIGAAQQTAGRRGTKPLQLRVAEESHERLAAREAGGQKTGVEPREIDTKGSGKTKDSGRGTFHTNHD